jgi:hypothetical protein
VANFFYVSIPSWREEGRYGNSMDGVRKSRIGGKLIAEQWGNAAINEADLMNDSRRTVTKEQHGRVSTDKDVFQLRCAVVNTERPVLLVISINLKRGRYHSICRSV